MNGVGVVLRLFVGPLISRVYPIFAATRARIRQARAGSDASLTEFRGRILTVLRETAPALARYAAALEQNAASEVGAERGRARQAALPFRPRDFLIAEQNRAAARQARSPSDGPRARPFDRHRHETDRRHA